MISFAHNVERRSVNKVIPGIDSILMVNYINVLIVVSYLIF